MRLSSKRERSAELLRLALPLLSARGANFGPHCHESWCSWVAGGSVQLAAALGAVVATRLRLTDADTQRVFAAALLAGRRYEMESMHRALANLLGSMPSAAVDMRDLSERLLHALSGVCGEAPDAAAPWMAHATGRARAMVDSLDSLSARL